LPAAAASCPDIMIVQDRSGSMVAFKIGGQTKWDIDLAALESVLPKFDAMAMGLATFPDENASAVIVKDACTPGNIKLDPKVGNSGAIIDFLKKSPQPVGGTPTWETLAKLQDYAPFKDTSRSHYVVLITDGQPNCTEKDCCPNLSDPRCDACKQIRAAV